MPTKFFTNQDDNSLLKKFEGVFSNIESIRHFDALVGYFRTSGYFKVRAFLDKIPNIRILVGINVDQLIKKYHDKGQLYLENPDGAKADFLEEIIKNIQEANYDEVTEKGKVLVVVPPAIEDNWRRTVKDFELDNHFRFITIGSLHKILDRENYAHPNSEDIDLIVIDESHKFRNDYTEMYLALQEICKMPRSRAAENGDTRKKVILISATPLNNRPQDIENQLHLFQDRRNSTLENIRNLQEYFRPINEQYKKLAYEKKLNIRKLKALFQKLRDDVVEPLVIRRTRTDIENNKEYLEDLDIQGIKFPKVGDPLALYYELDGRLSKLFFDTVSLITNLDQEGNEIDGLGYYRYRAIEFLVKEEDKKIYGRVESISGRLSAIINLHRSNVIVNYDVPWNSTRLMQRIGRVNRIGSRADRIYVYNYYPSAHGGAQIHLVNNALRKLQAFHTAFGEDNKVFSILEEKGEGALFGNKIQKEESEIVKYLNELRDIRKKHPKIYNDISKIPNKARCGRKVPEGRQLTLLDTESGEINYPLQNTSLTYLKSENHPGIFCLITPEMNIIEMNFLQAVKLFKALDNEKATVLDRYDLSPGSKEVLQSDKAHRGIVNLQIVLTQSFS